MKKSIIYLTLIAILLACSNKKEKPMNEITANNIVDKINEQVKRYPKEPYYYFYVGNSLCVYEILINDFPIQKSFKYEQQATPIYINYGIVKSGKQKVTYRIYPAPTEYNGGKDVFDPETQFDVEVYVNDNARGLQIGEETLITEYKAPTKIRMAGSNSDIALKEFEGKGQKYYEHSFYFNAEVPYQILDWSLGQDLTKLNQKDLEKSVVAFYLERRKEIEDKNYDAIASRVYTPLKEQFKSEYSDKNEIKKGWSELFKSFSNPSYKLQPFENYKMVFYGDGRMVALEQKNIDDIRLRGQSALWGKFKDENGSTRGDFNGIILYLPQGKGLNELQVIR